MRTGPQRKPRATREYQPANRRENRSPAAAASPPDSFAWKLLRVEKSKTKNFCLLTFRQPYQRKQSATQRQWRPTGHSDVIAGSLHPLLLALQSSISSEILLGIFVSPKPTPRKQLSVEP
jgi:hypothetical protein